MKNTKRFVAFVLTVVLMVSAIVPANAASFNFTVEKGSVLGSGDVTDTTHASTIVKLDDGKLISAWFGGSGEGDSDVRIWYSVYENGGWTSAAQIPSEDTVAHWNPVLQNFGSYVRLYYKVGEEIAYWVTKYVDSFDGGKTWTQPKVLVEGDTSGGRGPVKNKCLVTSKGIIIAPASSEQGSWNAFFDISEDGGKTWNRTPFIEAKTPKGKNVEMIQPSLWEDLDGNIHAFFRTKAGKIYRSDSYDGGYTWCTAYATSLPNNNSGVDVVMTDNGWLWLAYNPISVNGLRYKLVLSVSKDNGETWEQVTVIDSSAIIWYEYSYPALVADGNTIYLTYTYKRSKIKYLFVEFEG